MTLNCVAVNPISFSKSNLFTINISPFSKCQFMISYLSNWYTNMHENMHTKIPLTDNPNIPRKQEYRAPWMTSQSGVESKTNLIPANAPHFIKFVTSLPVCRPYLHQLTRELLATQSNKYTSGFSACIHTLSVFEAYSYV